MYLFVDLVELGVLTLVGEMWRYRMTAIIIIIDQN